MFKKNKLSIFEWFLLILIVNIPIVNVIFIVWGVLTNKFSQNLKNFAVAYVIFYILFVGGIWRGGFI